MSLCVCVCVLTLYLHVLDHAVVSLNVVLFCSMMAVTIGVILLSLV